MFITRARRAEIEPGQKEGVAPPPPSEIHPVNAYLTDPIPALVRRDEEQADHVVLATGFHEENQGVLLVVPVAPSAATASSMAMALSAGSWLLLKSSTRSSVAVSLK